jgi:two-component system sensor histidine kinase RegB
MGHGGSTRHHRLSARPEEIVMASNEAVAGRAPAADATGRVRLRTLVYIRWIAVLGQLLTLMVVRYGLGFELPFGICMAVIAISAALNIAITLRRPLGDHLTDRIAAQYLAYDILQLTVLLFLTGGLQNPFSVLILSPVVVSATVLPRVSTIALGLLSGAAITLLALWHLPFPWHPGQSFELPDVYVMGIWEALELGVVFIAAYAGSVSEEARRMSDALAATQMALAREQRMSALGALAAAAAHELGSPLATIAVTAKEMARVAPRDGSLADDIALLIEQSNRCRDILAELARDPEADGGSPFARLPITALVEAAAAPHMGSHAEILFEHRPGQEDGPPPIIGRSPEILHGLGNQIQNAAQFAADQVIVSSGWDREQVTVTVTDDGPGFPSHLLDRLGEPYLSSRGEGGHMGLGIFIASTLLKRTGATLSFYNGEGGGARVEVRWLRTAIEARP